MGADQTGYLIRGPLKMAEGRIKAAVRACTRARRELLALCAGVEDADDRSEIAARETGTYFDPHDIPENPEPVIREFAAWWRCTDSRDTCSRQDPDNPRQKLVYAGEMSWGDEPDGEGFQKIKQAFAWGFAEALGVR